MAGPRPVLIHMQPRETGRPTHHMRAQEAAYWHLVIKDEGELERRSARLFHAWLKRNPENIKEILKIADHDRTIDSHRLWTAISSAVEEIPDYQPPSQRDATVGRALSSSYLEQLRRDNRPAKWTLGVLSGLILGASISICPPALPAAAVSVGFLAAVALKEALVRYRVSRGLFGNTVREIRALLRFVLEHSTSIDFDDPTGRRRPAFEPEVRSVEQAAPPVGAIAE
jgi:hypothetical protein